MIPYIGDFLAVLTVSELIRNITPGGYIEVKEAVLEMFSQCGPSSGMCV